MTSRGSGMPDAGGGGWAERGVSGHVRARNPALDGIRALAVVAIVFHHNGLSWARGMFLGVDAFFVLSGFLITTLLVGEWQRDGRIDLGAFWLRRAKRLLPAALLVLAAVGAYAAFAASAEELTTIRRDALATLAT